MNLGRNLRKALAQVQANADRFGATWIVNVDTIGVYHAERLDSYSSPEAPAVRDAIAIVKSQRKEGGL